MKERSLIAIVSVLALVSAVASVTIASGEMLNTETNEPKIPRYSETCAHGHNGYDCKEPSFRTDITDLQKRVSQLERYH